MGKRKRRDRDRRRIRELEATYHEIMGEMQDLRWDPRIHEARARLLAKKYGVV